jgi:hypothetical protein
MALILSTQDYNNSSRIINLPTPIADTEPVRLIDLGAAIDGLSWKASVRCASGVNVSLSSPGTLIDGVTLEPNDRVLLFNQTNQSENGVYVWTGATSPLVRASDTNTADELEAAALFVEEGLSANKRYYQTQVNFTLGTDPITWIVNGASNPEATTTTQGTSRYATQAEVDAGLVNNAIITPSTLANYNKLVKKVVTTIGNGSSTSYTINHNLNTEDLTYSIFSTSTNAAVVADVIANLNTLTVSFSTPPASNAYKIVIIG